MIVIPVIRPLYKGSIETHRVARSVFERTNVIRARMGVGAVAWHPLLADVALRHTVDMEVRDYFGHSDPDGLGPGGRLRRYRPELVAAIGENLARIPTGRDECVAEELVARWMASPGHRENLVAPGFSHLGVAIVSNGPYVLATQLFGSVVAQLISPRHPFRVSRSSATDLRLRFYGPASSHAAVWVQAPDPSVAFRLNDGRMATGMYSLATRTEGQVCIATFAPHADAGDYRLLVGQADSDRLIPTNVHLQAV